MSLILLQLLGCWMHAASTFQILPRSQTTTSAIYSYSNEHQNQELSLVDKVWNMYQNTPAPTDYDDMIISIFPGALSNKDLETRVVHTLSEKGFTEANTLLATSLCCDELARHLEDDFVQVYGNNFNLGGLSGFPFAGNTGFENMALHIPDDGSCLIVYGPHVGVSTTGIVGKVERSGIQQVEACCASAIAAASNYLRGSTGDGVSSHAFTDLQQGAVQQLILPHIDTLTNAHDPMVELPHVLYDLQDQLVCDIIQQGCTRNKVKNNIALLGGIQINTAPQALDYFVPLRFDYMNHRGELIQDMLTSII